MEEYLLALLGSGRSTDMQDPNVIGDTAPTFADELRFSRPAEAS